MKDFTNSEGRIFGVRIIRKGDRYGLDDCLTVDGAPMVEFYDATYRGPKFGPRGQFVSRYYASTLLEGGRGRKEGLCLHGGEPVWSIDAGTMRAIREYVVETLTSGKTVDQFEVADLPKLGPIRIDDIGEENIYFRMECGSRGFFKWGGRA